MYQNTLHKCINNENNENNFIENRFLNIIWKNKIPNSIEIINNEKPKNATIYRKIKVKSLNNVFFSGLIESSDEFIKLPISTDSNLLSLLKSNLQKCLEDKILNYRYRHVLICGTLVQMKSLEDFL